MVEATVIVLDNSRYMQNQDYLPNRYTLQMESIKSIIFSKFDENNENVLGIVPTAQPAPNYITPTREKNHINLFISKLELNQNSPLDKILYLAIQSLSHRSQPNKRLIIFLGSPIGNDENTDIILSKIIDQIITITNRGVIVNMILFAEAMVYYEWLQTEIDNPNFNIVAINPDDNFYGIVSGIVGGITGEEDFEDDPELMMALKLSLEESQKNKQ
ncbi:26S proteasome non-ATPase regulatory subunit 4 [Astathelohania contejeani]|uniref:26S proteasome non-ATPase regulatory subunit 4 n=1 Tax=Astathelohania contejeani TaxID=164912 RepID=A0ABQ7I027_9MICR|nr:26S proteasome non-ATPase regulatory subunit 4 [Thelohania contejeani]